MAVFCYSYSFERWSRDGCISALFDANLTTGELNETHVRFCRGCVFDLWRRLCGESRRVLRVGSDNLRAIRVYAGAKRCAPLRAPHRVNDPGRRRHVRWGIFSRAVRRLPGRASERRHGASWAAAHGSGARHGGHPRRRGAVAPVRRRIRDQGRPRDRGSPNCDHEEGGEGTEEEGRPKTAVLW